MEPKGSLPRSQEPGTAPYTEPNEFSPQFSIPFHYDPF
jgi:hypothetical protein